MQPSTGTCENAARCVLMGKVVACPAREAAQNDLAEVAEFRSLSDRQRQLRLVASLANGAIGSGAALNMRDSSRANAIMQSSGEGSCKGPVVEREWKIPFLPYRFGGFVVRCQNLAVAKRWRHRLTRPAKAGA